jgi:hypothetical protein
MPVDETSIGGDTQVIEGTQSAPPAAEQESPAQEAAPSESAESSQDDGREQFFSLLSSELGELADDEEFKLDDFYKNLKPNHIKDLPTFGKQVIHNMRRELKLQQKKSSETVEAERKRLEAARADVEKRERDLAKQRADFTSVLNNPEVKKLFEVDKNAKAPDPFSPEGMKESIRRELAESLSKIFTPLQKESEKQQRAVAYADFVQTHPELKDPKFKAEVAGLMRERAAQVKAGAKVALLSSEDAYQIAKLRRLEAEQKRLTEIDKKARQASARQVEKVTVGGDSSGAEIPAEARKSSAKLAEYFRANPEAMRKVLRERGRVV